MVMPHGSSLYNPGLEHAFNWGRSGCDGRLGGGDPPGIAGVVLESLEKHVEGGVGSAVGGEHGGGGDRAHPKRFQA